MCTATSAVVLKEPGVGTAASPTRLLKPAAASGMVPADIVTMIARRVLARALMAPAGLGLEARFGHVRRPRIPRPDNHHASPITVRRPHRSLQA